jgi:small nuclear ribonucleoprotein (snRNP)-like protein
VTSIVKTLEKREIHLFAFLLLGSPLFDPLNFCDFRSADDMSPVEYVRRFLNQRIRVLLIDGYPQILGVFVALDHTKILILTDSVVVVEDNEHEVDVAFIPLVHVQSMELAVECCKQSLVLTSERVSSADARSMVLDGINVTRGTDVRHSQ